MFRFPWGDFHSLNLGWFLQKFDELRQDWATAEAGIDGALDAEIQKAEDALTDVFAARDAAAASASAANSSALNASQSSLASMDARDQSRAARDAAQQAASNAAGSETAAGNSATAASNSAGAAATSATQAGNSATAAGNSATAAGQSETAAAGSATAAAGSATAAADSATQAGNSASAAAQSAAAAAGSAAQIEIDASLLAADTRTVETTGVYGTTTTKIYFPHIIEKFALIDIEDSTDPDTVVNISLYFLNENGGAGDALSNYYALSNRKILVFVPDSYGFAFFSSGLANHAIKSIVSVFEKNSLPDTLYGTLKALLNNDHIIFNTKTNVTLPINTLFYYNNSIYKVTTTMSRGSNLDASKYDLQTPTFSTPAAALNMAPADDMRTEPEEIEDVRTEPEETNER